MMKFCIVLKSRGSSFVKFYTTTKNMYVFFALLIPLAPCLTFNAVANIPTSIVKVHLIHRQIRASLHTTSHTHTSLWCRPNRATALEQSNKLSLPTYFSRLDGYIRITIFVSGTSCLRQSSDEKPFVARPLVVIANRKASAQESSPRALWVGILATARLGTDQWSRKGIVKRWCLFVTNSRRKRKMVMSCENLLV